MVGHLEQVLARFTRGEIWLLDVWVEFDRDPALIIGSTNRCESGFKVRRKYKSATAMAMMNTTNS